MSVFHQKASRKDAKWTLDAPCNCEASRAGSRVHGSLRRNILIDVKNHVPNLAIVRKPILPLIELFEEINGQIPQKLLLASLAYFSVFPSGENVDQLVSLAITHQAQANENDLERQQ